VRANTILMKGLATILLPALLATPALAATRPTSIERAPSSWESFGSNLQLPQGELGARTPIESRIRVSLMGPLKGFASDSGVFQA
jgi:hypothetical protein